MKYTQIPANTFQQLQLNAGIIVDEFTPATGTLGNLLGATSGGNSFNATPSFKDFGEDIDNCPKNTKELKRIDEWDVKLSGTFVTITPTLAKMLVAAGVIDSTDTSKIVPKRDLTADAFDDVWFVCDYSDKNGSTNGGFIAIHLLNALNTGGFQIQSSDKEKGKFSFEFTAHYSISAPDTVPFEIYVKAGTAEPT